MEEINYLLIALAALVSIASPGPATLAIMGISMKHGRRYGLVLAFGILSGSLFWSTAAAFGLAAVMYANAWLFEMLRFVGAGYLIFLSYRSLRSALIPVEAVDRELSIDTLRSAYSRGLLLHLTNPKAILFFASLYSLAVPDSSGFRELLSVIVFVGLISASVFFGYAVLFSSAVVSGWYVRSKRLFETAFAIVFGVAGFKLLLSRVED